MNFIIFLKHRLASSPIHILTACWIESWVIDS
jgi:hypothetical protein